MKGNEKIIEQLNARLAEELTAIKQNFSAARRPVHNMDCSSTDIVANTFGREAFWISNR